MCIRDSNETNPTLATIWRLSQALDVSIERVLQAADDGPFLEKSSRGDTPMLVSEDGKCRLAIIGWIKTVEWLQWYDFSADPGGVLESEAHQRGSVESLSVSEGELEVEVGGAIERAKADVYKRQPRGWCRMCSWKRRCPVQRQSF